MSSHDIKKMFELIGSINDEKVFYYWAAFCRANSLKPEDLILKMEKI